jgi:hypothetical protein
MEGEKEEGMSGKKGGKCGEKEEERWEDTDDLSPVGSILRGDPFSCLPSGFGTGCPLLLETSDKAHTSTEIPTTILERPFQLRGDGKEGRWRGKEEGKWGGKEEVKWERTRTVSRPWAAFYEVTL